MASVAASVGALIPIPIAPLILVRSTQQITVGDLIARFLETKTFAASQSELHPKTLKRYVEVCTRLKSFLGESTALTDLWSDHFTAYRKTFPGTWGPAAIGAWVQCTRTLFTFAHQAELIDHPMRFGTDFKKPSRKLYRRARREKGLQMFEAEEIRNLLDRAKPVVKAMILLGVNCGFGNADCSSLPFSAIDLEGGWVNFPRSKTEIDRRCPLWPETITAIKRAILIRKKPVLPDLARYVFLNNRGLEWASPKTMRSTLTANFLRLMQRSRVPRRLFRNFYGLRRTFETIAGETRDQVAVNFIMGHAPASNDMAAVYRQRIDDTRLMAVVEHVRAWLMPDMSQFTIDEAKRRKALAIEINGWWESLETLDPVALQTALDQLGISQTELAQGIGYSPDWVNTLVRGRKRIGSDADTRLRAFIQQLSEGRQPTPLTDEQLWPKVAGPLGGRKITS